MKIVLATKNPSKVVQIKALFADMDIKVISLIDAEIEEDAVEDGVTLEENTLKKILFAKRYFGNVWYMADDTGLFIDILDEQPGIHAARWAGKNKSTEEIRDFTLDKLGGVPLEKRTARFKTVAVVMSPQGKVEMFEGVVEGKLLTEPRCECQKGMPYSSLFVPEGSEKVWAEMGTEEENLISHRGKAFGQVRSFFEKLLV